MSESEVRYMTKALKLEMARGWRYFSIAKQIEFQYAQNGMTQATYFFGGVAQACTDSAILSLAKVIDSQTNLSFWALLRVVKQHAHFFGDDATELIESHRTQLNTMKVFFNEIKHWRNNVLAHTSMDFVDSPEEMASFPALNLVKFERNFKAVYEMICEYDRRLGCDTVPLDNLSRKVEEDITYVIGKLNK